MKLKDLLLTKEEFPILNETGFQIPVHPRLLNRNLSINTTIAKKCFNELIADWEIDKELAEYYKENGLDLDLEKNPGWHYLTREEENGLVSYFSISRDYVGGIHFDEEDFESFSPIPNQHIKFSEKKAKEFEFKKIGNYKMALVYRQDNVDFFPGALFLRNWAIMYFNEVFKQVLS